MKKTFAFVLGFALIGASVISFTNASRDAYHLYMYQQRRQTTHAPVVHQYPQRTFSRRMGAYSRSRVYRRDTESFGVNPSQNMRYPQDDIRNRGALSKSQIMRTTNNTVTRPSSDRFMGRTQANAHRKGRITLKPTMDALDKFSTYENEKFSLKVPFGWRASNENAHLFTHPRSDYTIEIKHVEDICSDTGFQACVITLSKDLNHKNPAEKIAITGSIERRSHFYGTVLHEPLQTRTYTESFPALVEGKDLYIARHFVADLDGGVYIVEARTAFKNAASFIGVSKKVFDSFQVFLLEK